MRKIAIILSIVLVAAVLFAPRLDEAPSDKPLVEESSAQEVLLPNPGKPNISSVVFIDDVAQAPVCTPDVEVSELYDPQEPIAKLAQSGNPEHLLAAALMFPKDDNKRLDIGVLSRAYYANSKNPLILWDLYLTCRQRDGRFCKSENWERRLVAVDGQNSEVWAAIAGYRYQENDIPGALQALEQAAGSPTSNNYIIEQVRIIEQGLAASSDLGYAARLIQGFGFAAAKTRPRGSLLSACRDQGEVDRQWLRFCLAYGERLENQSNTLLDKSLGLSLQEKALVILDDQQGLDAASTRHANLKTVLRRIMQPSNVLLSNERVFAEYFDEWATHGELAAMNYIQAEYERLSNKEKLELCK